MRRLFTRILLPSLLLLLAVAALQHADLLHARLGLLSERGWHIATETLLWLTAAALVNGVVVRAIWHAMVRSEGREPPRLLLNVVAATVWLFAGIGVVTVVFGRSITDLITASSVLVAVIGFSLRAIIADFFYGLALAIERPFEVGDWIQVDEKTVGQVAGITWRSTRLVTRDLISVVIPNSLLASRHFRNYNRPKGYWRNAFRLRLGHDVPADQAERLLLSAVAHVPESAAIPEPAEARVVGFDGNGVEWELRYWHKDFYTLAGVDDRIRRAVLRNLRMAGIELPLGTHQIYLDQGRQGQGLEGWLARVDLFAGLPAEERQALAGQAREILARSDQPVVRQGEPGDSLFVLVEGFLLVHVADGEGQPHLVGNILPGGVFGEMSLLTGAPRAATVTPAYHSVVYEITREALEPYLRRHPLLAEQMSRILAERQTANSERIGASPREVAQQQETLAGQLLARIRGFFGLGEGYRAAG